MVLPRQNVDVPLGMGLDQKTGEPNVQAGKLLVAQDVRLRKVGSLESRPGYEVLPTTVGYPPTGYPIDGGYRVLACEDELLIDTGTRIYSYLPGSSRWIWRDTSHQAIPTRREYGERGLYTRDQPCEAIYTNGVYCQAWRSCLPGHAYDSVSVRAVDAVSGARHQSYTFTGTGETKFRLVSLGTKAYLFFFKADKIVASVLDLTMPYGLWAPPVEVVSALDSFCWEVCVCEGAEYMYLAYVTPAEAGGLVRVMPDLSIIGPAALSAMPQARVSVCAFSDRSDGRVWVSYDNNPDGIIVDTFSEEFIGLENSIILDPDTVADIGNPVGVTCLGSCVGNGGYAGKAFVSYTVQGDRPTVTRVWQILSDGTAEACTQTFHVVALSQPACVDGHCYLVATIPTWSATGNTADAHKFYNTTYNLDPKDTGPYGSPQWGAFLLQPEPYISPRMPDDSPPSRAVSRVSWGTAIHPVIQYWPVSLGQGRDAAELVCAVPQKTEDIDTSDSNVTVSEGFDVFTLGLTGTGTYNARDIHLQVAANHELVLSGGIPAVYDSNKLCEYGFHWYPAITLAKYDTQNGQLRASMTYDYAVTYEWADSKGVWHRSAPSLYRIYNELVDVKKTVTFQVPCLTVTDRQDQYDGTYPIRICLYRTRVQQNPDDPSQYQAIPGIYHLLEEKLNIPGQAYVEFTDNGVNLDSSDEKLREKRILYTVGSVVENIAPPAFRHMVYHVNRFWGVSADDPECIWFSKLHSFNELPGFFDGWVIRIAGADLHALASLDGKLIAFSRDKVYAIFGSGPSDTDQGNDLSEPQVVSSNIGCIDARSVVHTPVGVFFQGESGLYLLDRGMSVKPIGLPIEDTLIAFPVITGAAHVEADQEVRFTATDPNGTSSRVLVYSYLLDQWFVWTTPATSPVSPWITSSCVAMRNGEPRHTMLTSAGKVLREEGLTDPNGTRPSQSFRSAWIHMAGIQGYQRVRRLSLLGDYRSRCTVQVYGYADYKSSMAFSRSWTADEIDTMAANGRVQLQLHVPTQKCEALSVWVVGAPLDQAAGSPTASVLAVGIRFQGLSLEVGAKRGQSKNHSSGERK